MKDIPKSAQKAYKLWLSAFPESEHPNDWDRFYIFVGILLHNSKKERSSIWLGNCLRRDCNKLSNKRILKFEEIYDHIKNYRKAFKGDIARLLARDEMNKRLEKLRNQKN